jgi:Ca2+-binding EF-hand superfamily protein
MDGESSPVVAPKPRRLTRGGASSSRKLILEDGSKQQAEDLQHISFLPKLLLEFMVSSRTRVHDLFDTLDENRDGCIELHEVTRPRDSNAQVARSEGRACATRAQFRSVMREVLGFARGDSGEKRVPDAAFDKLFNAIDLNGTRHTRVTCTGLGLHSFPRASSHARRS